MEEKCQNALLFPEFHSIPNELHDNKKPLGQQKTLPTHKCIMLHTPKDVIHLLLSSPSLKYE